MNNQEEIKNVILKLNKVIEDARKKILECENKLNEIKVEPQSAFEKYGTKEYPVEEGEMVFWVDIDGIVYYDKSTKLLQNSYDQYPTREHAERIAKLQYLFKKALWIAEQLRDGYEWKKDNNYKYCILYRNNVINIEAWRTDRYTPFYFQSKEKAGQFIEIMGEDDLKYLLTGGEN